MHYDGEKHQAQQLEQVIATIFACRSVIKYNLSVDEKQQERMLQDIDASLEVLRACALNMPLHLHLTDRSLSQVSNTTIVRVNNETLRSDASEHVTLQALYRMYHAFLDVNEKTNLQAFVLRFDEVISVLGEVQRLFEQRSPLAYDTYSASVLLNNATLSVTVEGLLQKVKVFISDLYYIFMDFIRMLSSVLEQNDVHLNTEKLVALSEQRSKKIHRIQLERLHGNNLQNAQEACQQLQQRRVQVEPQIREVTAFLDFLKESLCAPDTMVYQMSEILAQTDTVSQLLSELLHIVSDYEKISKI
jgi:hypothetical protein